MSKLQRDPRRKPFAIKVNDLLIFDPHINEIMKWEFQLYNGGWFWKVSPSEIL